MAQLSISTSDPTDGATDVFVNDALNVTFASAVLSSSVSNTTVVLTDMSTDGVIDAVVELVGTTVVRITPNGHLAEDTVFRITFPGTDTALSSSYVLKDSTEEALATTLTVTFRTGSRVKIDDSSVDKDAGDLSLEGDLNLPANVKALGSLVVKKTNPKNHSADVAPGLAGSSNIDITFDKHLASGDFDQSWLTVTTTPILDDTTWLGAISGDGWLGTGEAIPGYDITHSNNVLTVDFSGNVPKNLCIQVEVSEDITDIDGEELGPNGYLYSITTDRWPKISGVHSIKREIRSATDGLQNDYIAAVLFSKSVEFINRFDLSSSPHLSVVNWVVNSAVVEILDDVELEKAIVAGTRRQLGDVNVSVDPVIGKLSIKHARAQKKLELSAKTLVKNSIVAKRYCNYNTSDVQRTSRLWFGVSGRLLASRFITYQGPYPGSNTSINRQAKVPPGSSFW